MIVHVLFKVSRLEIVQQNTRYIDIKCIIIFQYAHECYHTNVT